MNPQQDDWNVWRWCVIAGLVSLLVIVGYRVAGEALAVADRFVSVYERTHAPRLQQTSTDWPTGESRQSVNTQREHEEKIDAWLARHDDGVIGSSEAARRRAISDAAKGGSK